MTGAVDPDPYADPAADPGVGFGGRDEPADGDPTAGGKTGDIGTTDSIAADEPDDGSHYAVGGGSVGEESNAVPHADPGPEEPS
ncbi:hypothetical protein [Modestobacter italicus]|uniref:hypothetical protein n=1 Tax=Modestobacter italicus (strain DSM 44449 / CECT 9708 / BC 501) TaxID=2732864 RepID=UPI001C96C551|nr:hypothetical protein [Modestobacter italicus]